MRTNATALLATLIGLCILSTSCSKNKEPQQERVENSKDGALERDMIDVGSGQSVKLHPYFSPQASSNPPSPVFGKSSENSLTGGPPTAAPTNLPFVSGQPEGLIHAKRPANASTGLVPIAALTVAVLSCANLPVINHPGTDHGTGFITFPSLNSLEHEDHQLDVKIVNCVQQLSDYDFVASIIPAKTRETTTESEMSEWFLGDVAGDISPFRNLHAKKD